VDFMEGKMASCEIFVMEIWKILAPAISAASPNAKLHYIKLIETPKNFVEYYGE
jgi:6-pyruvoyltetrahydropterin/6-carboxytetrahydropterin synthase